MTVVVTGAGLIVLVRVVVDGAGIIVRVRVVVDGAGIIVRVRVVVDGAGLIVVNEVVLLVTVIVFVTGFGQTDFFAATVRVAVGAIKVLT